MIDSTERARLLRLVTSLSVGTASLLLAVKAFAWVMTGSAAILGSLVDSASDVVASVINLVAIRHAISPADHEHRFGHGKAESLAGLAQAVFVAATAVVVAAEGISRFVRARPIESAPIGVAVMLLSLVVTGALVLFQRRISRLTGSTAVAAEQLHYASDVLLYAGVLAALGLSEWAGFHRADGLFAVLISLWIFAGAVRIARVSAQNLMDHELPDADRARIVEICRRNPDVRGLHDLRTRRSGSDLFIQLHLELDGALPLRRAHRIAAEVERAVREAFPQAEVLIHQDPAELNEPGEPSVP